MDADIIQDIAIPLLSVKNRCFMSISTPNGENPDNPLRRIMLTADPNKPCLYNVMEQTLHCPECNRLREQAIEEGENPDLYPSPESTGQLCPHLRATLPRWKDPSRLELVHDFYEASGTLDSYKREMLGQDSIDRNAIFDPMTVHTFTDRSFGHPYRPPFLVMTADPNLGGPSELSIVTGYFQPDSTGGFIICGMEAEAVEAQGATSLIQEHIRAIRKVDRFSQSTILFVPELNLVTGAMYMTKAAQEMGNVVLLYSRQALTSYSERIMFGIRTGAESKELYTEVGHEFLQHPYSGIAEDLVCVTPRGSSQTIVQRRLATVEKLNEQLRRWARIVDHRRHTRSRGKLSGKGPSGRDNDDLAVAFLLCCYVARRCITRQLQIPDASYNLLFREK